MKDQLNIRGVDQLLESVLTEDTNFVIDNGASSFLPFGRYMVETDVPGLIQAHGKRLVVHSVVAGGGAVAETLHGLEVLAASMPAARLIVWINEYFGPVPLRDKPFEEMQVYQQHRGRMTDIIRLRRSIHSSHRVSGGCSTPDARLPRHLDPVIS